MKAAAGVLITNDRGRVLLVKPNYRPHWDIPGGIVENGESPRAAAVREAKEELGLTVTPSRLLVVDYLPHRPGHRSEMTAYIFAIAERHLGPISLDPGELSDWAWTTAADRRQMLERHAPILHRRVSAALVAHFTGLASYLESGLPV